MTKERLTTPTSPGWDRCRVGLWGSLDQGSFGDQVAARVARLELGRRLPLAEIVAIEPGDPAPLDCIVVTSTAPGLEALLDVESGPMVWHAVTLDGEDNGAVLRKALAGHAQISVADDRSKRRLEDLGVDGEVAVVPHPAVLAPRLFSQALVEKRLAYLRLMGWYPPNGEALLVHADGKLDVEAVHRLAGDVAVVRLPEASVEDVVAAVAGSSGVVTTSIAVAAAALAFGRPHVLLDEEGVPPDELPPAPGPEVVRRRQDELDASYDCVAAVVTEATAGRPDRPGTDDVRELLDTLAALRRAAAAQARRLVAQRLAFADASAELAERLRQTEESLAAHAAVVAAQEGVIAGQKRALVEHQQAMLSLAASVDAQAAELERARALFDGVQAHVASLEARLADEAAGRASAEGELTAIRSSRTFRVSSTLAGLSRLARRRRK